MTRKNNTDTYESLREDLQMCDLHIDNLKKALEFPIVFGARGLFSGAMGYLIYDRLPTGAGVGIPLLLGGIAGTILTAYSIWKYKEVENDLLSEIKQTADYQRRVLSGNLKPEDIPLEYGLDILANQL